ncbi:sugar porter family MFS transporter [Acidipila sp. EB88]|uniref:sugar porter family MFS transporter n=1 Tax=Acidipila sp. EB88 TaxID=2305226 RepID=UPI001F34F915|nr:sugar porter family MFS transporter [Acidipila sp. EB88]
MSPAPIVAPKAQSFTGAASPTPSYNRFLIVISGLGGMLYGADIGIFAAALLYLGPGLHLSDGQVSSIAAAVFAGSTISSLVAGFLADVMGRKSTLILGGLLFIVSVGIIVSAHNFDVLLGGRLLQGVAGGVFAVVVPLFLAESLSPEMRGRGTAVFQFMLTVGIVLASAVGVLYTSRAEAVIGTAHGNQPLIISAQNHAWRGMFLACIYPGLLLCIGTIFLSETPRWLFRHGRRDAALVSLRRSSSEEAAQLQMREMESTSRNEVKLSEPRVDAHRRPGSLLQRKFIVPFVLACVVLTCNQTTGINSVLTFLVKILQRAGMNAVQATHGDVAVKLLNVIMTLVGVALIDKKGRRWLLKLGTSGLVVALTIGSVLLFSIEHGSLAPSDSTGWLMAGSLALFIASYAVGPGVVVWLVLSELMPTRIRSAGMGIALLLNQGASTAIAGLFLPVVGRYGYWVMFLFWTFCTIGYFFTAMLFVPETTGKTLEEIEQHFEGKPA